MILRLGFAIQLAALLFFTLLAIWSIKRGIQNGVKLLLVSGMLPMSDAMLIHGGTLPHLTMDRVVWPVLVLFFVLRWRKGELNRVRADLLEYSMIVLLIIIIISMYAHGSYIGEVAKQQKLQLHTILSGFLYPFLIFFLMRRATVSWSQVKSFLTGVGLITVYLGWTGVAEALHVGWLVFPKSILDPRMGIHFGLVRGPFLNASWNGLAMAMGLPVLLWLLMMSEDVSRWIWLLGIALVGIALPYIFQRAAWLSAAFALGIAVMAWPKRGPMLMGAMILIAALGGLALPEKLQERIDARLADVGNIEYRLRIIDRTIGMINEHLMMGVGYDRFNKTLVQYGMTDAYSSHNTILAILAELGLVGFLPYLAIFGLLLLKSAKAYWQVPWSRVMIGGLWGITAAYFIMAMSVELRGVLYVHVLLFGSWGMILGMVQRQSILRQGGDTAYRRVVSFV